eukprot:1147912-Pelagomonas_calceolata.AAC.1
MTWAEAPFILSPRERKKEEVSGDQEVGKHIGWHEHEASMLELQPPEDGDGCHGAAARRPEACVWGAAFRAYKPRREARKLRTLEAAVSLALLDDNKQVLSVWHCKFWQTLEMLRRPSVASQVVS